jgi:hypothetical protein
MEALKRSIGNEAQAMARSHARPQVRKKCYCRSAVSESPQARSGTYSEASMINQTLIDYVLRQAGLIIAEHLEPGHLRCRRND